MKLIAGLGNPGKNYSRSRHNIGFMLLDRIAESNKKTYSKAEGYSYFIVDGDYYVKPELYMNRSGLIIGDLMNSKEFDDVFIIVDDINLDVGKLRFRLKGGDGGHNGLKSIIECLGHKDWKRLRIGVGLPAEKELSDYVLGDFSDTEMTSVEESLELSQKFIEIYCKDSFQKALDFVSKSQNNTERKKPKSYYSGKTRIIKSEGGKLEKV
eukprot:Anaeramoba_ignava/c18078_g1_i1.p3 GENE.c18078_g1_i1~~c18078_g1_i1.p3  ORF type:complete len:210 (+),score=26.27 c18078_g1_i1:2558-3187(+)